ncbi:MAG: polysulfide reductase NrfD [Deltaproteobacteria bacterium]|nr:polysulfide reductase NrfD [Deltaproteobacteria bacterium]
MTLLIKFAIDSIVYILKGSVKFYAWLALLGFLSLIYFFGLYQQLVHGLIFTNFNDQVSWGLYESNFIFLVGVAAAAVTVVFPAYVYHHKQLKSIVVLGEMVAITAVTMVILFILLHLGRADRLWHIIPGIGIFNFPNSMLTWDVLVLNVYLGLNVICAFYYLYKKYTHQPLNDKFYLPVVYISIVWALSIHTVTAFLINTMPARPMWFHSMMPIKFISTAFASGPALIIIAFLIIKRTTALKIEDEAIELLAQIATWCLGIALFLAMSEIVTELYPSTEHSFSLKYLLFGKHGLSKLVPWIWSSFTLNIVAFLLLLNPNFRKNHNKLLIACVMIFVGVWIEKGMGLVVPAYIPTPIGEFSEYTPSLFEIMNAIGAWALGLMMFTILAKGAIGVLLGEISYDSEAVKKSDCDKEPLVCHSFCPGHPSSTGKEK